MDLQRWLALMERLHLPPARVTFDNLVKAYTAAERRYHSDVHIRHCLAELDAAAHHIPNRDPLELALWFHDAVYDPYSASNETESARWAADFLASAHAAETLTDGVVALILATRHHPIELSRSAQWIVDIDLAILGSDPDRFTAYERAIRQEYAWVPNEVFRDKRTAVLRSFLDRPAIYATSHFRSLYEEQARSNLLQSIQRLKDDLTAKSKGSY